MADKLIRKVSFNAPNKDIVVQNELCLLLFKHTDLLGFYIGLSWAFTVGLLDFTSQKFVAGVMGMSEPTFIKRRKKLEQFGLLTVTDGTGGLEYEFTVINRLQIFRPEKKSPKELVKYIQDAIKLVSVATDNQLALEDFLPEEKRKEVKRYPKENYKKVLAAFQKYKGIQLIGHEQKQAMRAIKIMFSSDRTVPQIISFMKWISEHESHKDYEWLKRWTIWTVQKKLPEFLAGKLEDKKDQTDDYETIRDTTK